MSLKDLFSGKFLSSVCGKSLWPREFVWNKVSQFSKFSQLKVLVGWKLINFRKFVRQKKVHLQIFLDLEVCEVASCKLYPQWSFRGGKIVCGLKLYRVPIFSAYKVFGERKLKVYPCEKFNRPQIFVEEFLTKVWREKFITVKKFTGRNIIRSPRTTESTGTEAAEMFDESNLVAEIKFHFFTFHFSLLWVGRFVDEQFIWNKIISAESSCRLKTLKTHNFQSFLFGESFEEVYSRQKTIVEVVDLRTCEVYKVEIIFRVRNYYRAQSWILGEVQNIDFANFIFCEKFRGGKISSGWNCELEKENIGFGLKFL